MARTCSLARWITLWMASSLLGWWITPARAAEYPPIGVALVEPGLCLPACRESGGVDGGIEFAFLRPYVGALSSVDGQLAEDRFAVARGSNDFGSSPRAWIGYTGATGLGARLRYWQFDHGLAEETFVHPVGDAADGENAQLLSQGRLHLYAVDGEIYQRLAAMGWNIEIAAGVRYAEAARTRLLGLAEAGLTTEQLRLDSRFRGLGPSLSARLARPLGGTGLAFVANARGSLLFGEQTTGWAAHASADPSMQLALALERHSAVATAELQSGLEWNRRMRHGAQVFVHALAEAQLWTAAGGSGGPAGNIGLTGFTLGAGWRW